MSGGLGILAFVVMLIIVVMIHEAAHYGFAKWFGFKVEEYFLGFGPKLWSFRRGETEYGVKAIPAGGYVKIAGMNPFQPVPRNDPDFPRTYSEKPIWQRAIVIAGGPATHFVLALIFCAIGLGLIGRAVDNATFGAVAPRLNGVSSPAARAGLHPDDRVLSMSSGKDQVSRPTIRGFGEFIDGHVGEPIRLVVERDGRRIAATATPVVSEVDGAQKARIGVIIGAAREPIGLIDAVAEAPGEVWDLTRLSLNNMGRVFGPEGVARLGELLFTDAPREATDAASIVGVSRAAGVVTEQSGVGYLMLMFAFVNIFIGILNLLPLPPFDGGHLAVVLIERIRGRKVDARKLVPVSAVVLAFFVVFTSAVVILDLTKPLELAP
jgi:membrane-associated protease RseP (regulator of RpoE activity)